MRKTMAAAALAALATLLPAGAMADKGGKHHGHGKGHGNEHYKYEFQDWNGCKVEIKKTPGVYKEERKCKEGPAYYAPPVRYSQLPRVLPMPMPGLPSLACNRETIGGVLGGIAGAAVGSQFGKGDGQIAATIGGTLLGVLVGGSIGRSMDSADMGCVGQALEYAPPRQPVVWSNPGAGADYRVTPVRNFERDGSLCREYQTTVTIGGRRQNAYGTACRTPDGDWQLVK